MSHVYAGVLSDGTVYRYVAKLAKIDAGSAWNVNGVAAYSSVVVAVDDVGNVHYATVRKDQGGGVYASVFKCDVDGNQLWMADTGADCFCITVDASGNVFVGGTADGDGNEIHAYDADGDWLWSATAMGQSVYGIDVDALGHVYTTSYRWTSDGHQIRQFDASNGTELWKAQHPQNLFACAAFPDGGCVAAGNSALGISTREFDVDGNLVNSISALNSYAVAVDDNDRLALGTLASTGVMMLDSARNELWTYLPGETVRALAIDPDGNTYVGFKRTSDVTMAKLDYDGDVVWTWDAGNYYNSAVNGLAADPGRYGAGFWDSGTAVIVPWHLLLQRVM